MLKDETKSIYQTILGLEYFKNLSKIVQKAQKQEMLDQQGPFTLFGPHDGAFYTFTTYEPDDLAHEIPVISLEEVLASPKSAEDVLSYLLIPARYTLRDLRALTAVTALNGQDIPLTVTNGNIIPGNSYLMNSDIECTNGIIHVTGSVLQPTL